MEYINSIMKDLFTMIYQYAGISIIVTLLFLRVWKRAESTSWKEEGKNLIIQLKERVWKKRLISVLYIVFVLQRTLFNRSPWGNPLENILGPWGLVIDGIPNYEMFENIILFLPIYWIVKISGVEEYIKHWKKVELWGVLLIPIECTIGIELIQLMTRAGTFQLSDIVYNTVGGIIGGIVYRIFYSLKQKKEDKNSSYE